MEGGGEESLTLNKPIIIFKLNKFMITYIFKYMYRFLNFTFSESIQYILFLHGQYPALEYQVQFKPTLDPTGVHISRST